MSRLLTLALVLSGCAPGQPLPGTAPLEREGDPAQQMGAALVGEIPSADEQGIARWLYLETGEGIRFRAPC